MEYTAPQSQSINILDVLRGIGRRKMLILTIFSLAVLLGSALVMLLKPVYTTEAQILVENLATPFDRTQATQEQRAEVVDDRVVLSQISVIKSQDLVSRVISTLKLTERPEFNPMIQGLGTTKQITLLMGFGDDPRIMTPEQRAQKRVFDQMTVYQVPESNVIALKYSGNDGATAAEVANTLAEFYVMSTREAQSSPTGRARDWLGQQIEDLRKKVAVSEDAVERFRNQAGLLQGQTVTLGTEELSELSKQITVAEGSRAEAEAKVNEINELLKNQGSVDTSNEVLGSPIVQRLREQQVASTRRMSELSATYLSNHPRMIAAQNDLANIDKQLRKEALKVVAGLEGQAKIAAAREKSLRDSLEQMKGRESTANIDEVQLKALERNAAADRSLLESMLSRYSDASARQGEAAQPGLARIIQMASAPSTPSFPKPGPMIMLISFAGLFIGLGLAFLLEVMAAANRLQQNAERANTYAPSENVAPALSLRNDEPQIVAPVTSRPTPTPTPALAPAQVVEQARAPVFSPVIAPSQPQAPPQTLPTMAILATSPSFANPMIALEAAQALNENDRFGLGEAAVRISSQIDKLRQGPGGQYVAMMSLSGRDTDCSLSTLALARVLSEQKMRTIVVDVDPNSQAFEMLFGLPMGPGLVDLVSGASDFTKIICRDPASSAHVVRFGLNKTPAALALLKLRIDAVMTTFAGIYDVVLIHGGEANANTPSMLGGCNLVFFVAPAARQHDVAAAAQTLQKSGISNVFFVSLENHDGVVSKLEAVS